LFDDLRSFKAENATLLAENIRLQKEMVALSTVPASLPAHVSLSAEKGWLDFLFSAEFQSIAIKSVGFVAIVAISGVGLYYGFSFLKPIFFKIENTPGASLTKSSFDVSSSEKTISVDVDSMASDIFEKNFSGEGGVFNTVFFKLNTPNTPPLPPTLDCELSIDPAGIVHLTIEKFSFGEFLQELIKSLRVEASNLDNLNLLSDSGVGTAADLLSKATGNG